MTATVTPLLVPTHRVVPDDSCEGTPARRALLARCTKSEAPPFDPTRLGDTLARLRPRMLAVAKRIVRNPDTAEDVVQNAFEKVIRKHIDSDALYDGESRKLMRVEDRDIEIVAEFLEDLIDHDLG